jgi:hypothetical protein
MGLKYPTVFQAEVEAINQGVRMILDIIHDTESILKYGYLREYQVHFISGNKRAIKSKTIKTCRETLMQLANQTKINLN